MIPLWNPYVTSLIFNHIDSMLVYSAQLSNHPIHQVMSSLFSGHPVIMVNMLLVVSFWIYQSFIIFSPAEVVEDSSGPKNDLDQLTARSVFWSQVSEVLKVLDFYDRLKESNSMLYKILRFFLSDGSIELPSDVKDARRRRFLTFGVVVSQLFFVSSLSILLGLDCLLMHVSGITSPGLAIAAVYGLSLMAILLHKGFQAWIHHLFNPPKVTFDLLKEGDSSQGLFDTEVDLSQNLPSNQILPVHPGATQLGSSDQSGRERSSGLSDSHVTPSA